MQEGTVRQAGRFTQRVLMLWAVMMSWHSLSAQKVIVLTDADIGKDIRSAVEFTEDGQQYSFSFIHRLEHKAPMDVRLENAKALENFPFSTSTALPFTIKGGETKTITFTVDYNQGIRDNNQLVLVMAPQGDKDPTKRGVKVILDLKAQGHVMFWNDPARRYQNGLGEFTYPGPGDKLLELAWNGAGTGSCTFRFENDERNAFSLIPNASGAGALAPGSPINMGKGGRSFFVRYAPPRRAGSDGARLVFIEDGTGRTISVDLLGAANGQSAMIAAARTNLKGGNDDPTKGERMPVGAVTITDGGKMNIGNDNSGKLPVAGTGPKPSASVSGPNAGDGMGSGVAPAKDDGGSSGPDRTEGPQVMQRRLLSPEEALAFLNGFYERHRRNNMIGAPQLDFEQNKDGAFEAKVPLKLDSLGIDPNLQLTPLQAKATIGGDSVDLEQVRYVPDSMAFFLRIPEEGIDKLSAVDSFEVWIEFRPEYLAADNTPVYLEDQTQTFTGSALAKIKTESNWLMWLLIGLGALVFLFFFLGRLWVRQPVKSFRYLRESRYQRERYKGRENEAPVEIETVYLDLSRQETDLIQLSFLIRGSGEDAATEKHPNITANVPAPHRSGLKKFFAFFFSIFGMKKEPRFKSVYYSLRVEPAKGGIPQHLRMKDDEGMLMLGTSLTGNVLATDHQDFRFLKRPFTYSLYLDPSEILDYTGAMKSVTIPFKVIEEPFEGYVMTRDFRLNLEITPKYA